MKKIFLTLAVIVCSVSMNAQIMKIMKGDQLVKAYSAAQADKVSFEEEVEPDADYLAMLGTYTFSAYDYFDEVPVSGTLVVEADVVNESFKISIPGIGWCPEQGQYIDHFSCPWDKDGKKSLLIPQGALGDEGISWNYADLGICGIALELFYYDSETTISGIVLTADANGNLSATYPEISGDDYFCFQAGIYNEEGSTGYANGILIFNDGLNFTKNAVNSTSKNLKNGIFKAKKSIKTNILAK